MNISMNNMNSTVSQVSRMYTGYNNANLSKTFQSKNVSSDEMSISPEGKAMSRMLKNDQSREQREAHKTAFQSTYSELDIESLDAESMTDEELKELLTAFESSMSEHMHEGYKPASEMASSELRDALTNVQGMNDKISESKGHYGPPPGGKGPKGAGGPKGPKPGGGQNIESINTDLEEDDFLSSFLEVISEYEEEATSNLYSTKSMDEILEMISISGTNI